MFLLSKIPLTFLLLLFFQAGCMAELSKTAKKSGKNVSLSYKSDVNGGGIEKLPLKGVTAYYTIDNKQLYATIHYPNLTGRPGQHAMSFRLFLVGRLPGGKIPEEGSVNNVYMIHTLHRKTHSAMRVANVKLQKGVNDILELSMNIVSSKVLPEYASFNKYMIDMVNIPLVKVASLTELKKIAPNSTSNEGILRRNFRLY
jgi:hypothetical protein